MEHNLILLVILECNSLIINRLLNQVLHHIIPISASTVESEDPKIAAAAKEVWSRNDAIVLQWIYGTISSDLLHTIIKLGSTAHQAWERLQGIFHDNKNTRAVYLEGQFTSVRLENFSTVSAYCQELKSLADRLANVGVTISDQRLVLQIIKGLNETYNNVASFIQQTNPLPSFYETRSRLVLEESRLAHLTAVNAQSAATSLVASTGNATATDNQSQKNSNYKRGSTNRHWKGKQGNSHHNNKNKGSNNIHGGAPNETWSAKPNAASSPMVQRSQFPPWFWSSQWAMPPCPHPTTAWARPPLPRGHAAILGQRPQSHQAFPMQGPPQPMYTPTNIDEAFHTMTLQAPDANWYMDTGATSHMTANPGYTDGEETFEM